MWMNNMISCKNETRENGRKKIMKSNNVFGGKKGCNKHYQMIVCSVQLFLKKKG